MIESRTSSTVTDEQFVAIMEILSIDDCQRNSLTEMLREDHPIYNERSAVDVVRMRGWLFVALAKFGLRDGELIYALEELESGSEPYLVAAAARSLRSYREPRASFAPYLISAIANIRYRDEPVSFEKYADFPGGRTTTTAVGEVLTTLSWLGSQAKSHVDDIAKLCAKQDGLPPKLHSDVRQVLWAIRSERTANEASESCCELPSAVKSVWSWAKGFRRDCKSVEEAQFEDHLGISRTFRERFVGQPSIVAFFYTRCDNPQKCSLTVNKMGTIRKILHDRQLDQRIQTALITYDPEYDTPARLRQYAKNRSLELTANHCLLRTTMGFESVRRFFELGVNFIDSFVNRHQIEVFVLDQDGRIALSFRRLQWDIEDVIVCANRILAEHEADRDCENAHPQSENNSIPKTAASFIGTFATSLAIAFFPKCPVCWAAYLSFFGIAGADRLFYGQWVTPALIAMIVLNLGCLWYRARYTQRYTLLFVALIGMAILMSLRLGMGINLAAH